MPAKKKEVEAPKYPGDFTSPLNKIMRLGLMKSGFNDVAWISRTKFNSEQLRKFADWASKTADYIDFKEQSKIK